MKFRSVHLLALALVLAFGCAPDFDPVSKVQSVRILATRADKPYAKPGDTIQLEVLADDARKDRSRPMNLFWLPAPCVNPPLDAYYACYPLFGALFQRGVDLDAVLVRGEKLSVQVPSNTLETSTSKQIGTPFGTIIAFSMACAGHIRYVGTSKEKPQAVPFACVDDSGQPLGPDDFVFAYSRMFVFADRTNTNPVLEGLTLDGQAVDPAAGLTLDHCVEDKNGDCPKRKVDVVIPASSQEPDPSVTSSSVREAIWANYYVTDGKVKSDVRVVFAAEAGRLAGSENELEAPKLAGDQRLWVVIHDNRGGVAWMTVPIHVR